MSSGPLLTAAGQIFWMDMYHPDHPDGEYRTANRVQVLDRPSAISWEPGYDTGDGTLAFGGWVWRYDLVPALPAGPPQQLPLPPGRPGRSSAFA